MILNVNIIRSIMYFREITNIYYNIDIFITYKGVLNYGE